MENMTAKSRYEAVQEMLQELPALGLDCQADLDKLDKKLKDLTKEKLSIALVGAFSDGKTSVIAGLAGDTLDGMQIAVDEATDEIHIYEPDEAKMPCRMVDTPGLFGTKEKDVAGRLKYFDDITRRYFDEAPVLLYVVESKNPIKDSHKELLRHVMRDLRKADRMIFVVNRMDDVADVTDDEAYAKQAEIKKNTVRTKLEEHIGLTMEESQKARIVCIAADPERRGMAFWKDHMDTYMQRSHIGELKAEIEELLAGHTEGGLLDDASRETACVLLRENITAVGDLVENYETSILPALHETNAQQKKEVERAKMTIERERNACYEDLDDYRNKLVGEIHGLTLDNAEVFVKMQIGQIGEEYGHHFSNELEKIMERHFSVMRSEMESLSTSLEQLTRTQENLFADGLKKGVKGLKHIPKGVMIEGVRKGIFIGRDLLGKIGVVIKFKPWQVVKMARLAPAANGILAVVMMVYDVRTIQQRNARLAKLKEELHNAVEDAIKETRESIKGEKLYENYAPHIPELEKVIAEGRIKIEELEQNMRALTMWQENAENLLKKMQPA